MGHSPVRVLSNGNLQYKCPLPDHTESKPSFVVYTNDQFENFYCFGCQRKYHIIHLISFMENISFREVVDRLSDGEEISTEEDLSMVFAGIDKDYKKIEPSLKLAETMLSINSLCSLYLRGVGHDDIECSIMDKMWSSVDRCLLDFNFDDIEEMLKHLPSMLNIRHRKYNKRQAAALKEQYTRKG